MMNHVDLMGRLVCDPELRRTERQKPVTTLRVAVDRTRGEGADFLDVVAWDKTAENICRYLRKGSLVAVEGRLQSRSWQDKEGNSRHAVEVVADTVHFVSAPRKQAEEPGGDGGGGLPEGA